MIRTLFFNKNFILKSTLSRMKRFTEVDSDVEQIRRSLSFTPTLHKEDILTLFQKDREESARSILDFSFLNERVRILSKVNKVPDKTEGILYWMSRDARVQDNWAFLYAQKLALTNALPLHCCFSLVPKFLDATIRHYKFMLKGLMEVEKDLEKLDIQFHLLIGHAVDTIPKFVKECKIGGVVCDFSPLRVPIKWVDDMKKKLPENIPLYQVDAHNIVPVWEASDKLEYAAYTIRPKITSKLDKFLTKYPPLIKHKYKSKNLFQKNDWEKAFDYLEVNMEVNEVNWAEPGYKAGCNEIKNFCEKRLSKYKEKRNDPTIEAQSNLAPWVHFGQISMQRTILQVKKYKKLYPESVDEFCEQGIIRRELADNFCLYNQNYDNLNCCDEWALKTLNDHRKDKREHIYTKEEFETAKTLDIIWNSAQIQLIKEGKLHGFFRMYWAKKILEWTKTPEEALEICIYLNDKYSLDGRDPNGYVGILWSIAGIHDRPFPERPVTGRIRHMTVAGCKRKFDVSAFVARYSGKVYRNF